MLELSNGSQWLRVWYGRSISTIDFCYFQLVGHLLSHVIWWRRRVSFLISGMIDTGFSSIQLCSRMRFIMELHKTASVILVLNSQFKIVLIWLRWDNYRSFTCLFRHSSLPRWLGRIWVTNYLFQRLRIVTITLQVTIMLPTILFILFWRSCLRSRCNWLLVHPLTIEDDRSRIDWLFGVLISILHDRSTSTSGRVVWNSMVQMASCAGWVNSIVQFEIICSRLLYVAGFLFRWESMFKMFRLDLPRPTRVDSVH